MRGIETAFPYYLAFGMTAEEYWEGDPYLAPAYKQKHDIELETNNQAYWLQGLYNYMAMRSALDAFGYQLGGCKGKQPDGYIERPIPITEHEKQVEKERSVAETIEWIEKGMAGKNG